MTDPQTPRPPGPLREGGTTHQPPQPFLRSAEADAARMNGHLVMGPRDGDAPEAVAYVVKRGWGRPDWLCYGAISVAIMIAGLANGVLPVASAVGGALTVWLALRDCGGEWGRWDPKPVYRSPTIQVKPPPPPAPPPMRTVRPGQVVEIGPYLDRHMHEIHTLREWGQYEEAGRLWAWCREMDKMGDLLRELARFPPPRDVT